MFEIVLEFWVFIHMFNYCCWGLCLGIRFLVLHKNYFFFSSITFSTFLFGEDFPYLEQLIDFQKDLNFK